MVIHRAMPVARAIIVNTVMRAARVVFVQSRQKRKHQLQSHHLTHPLRNQLLQSLRHLRNARPLQKRERVAAGLPEVWVIAGSMEDSSPGHLSLSNEGMPGIYVLGFERKRCA
jgi:hypothetical protein